MTAGPITGAEGLYAPADTTTGARYERLASIIIDVANGEIHVESPGDVIALPPVLDLAAGDTHRRLELFRPSSSAG